MGKKCFDIPWIRFLKFGQFLFNSFSSFKKAGALHNELTDPTCDTVSLTSKNSVNSFLNNPPLPFDSAWNSLDAIVIAIRLAVLVIALSAPLKSPRLSRSLAVA